MFDEVHPSTTAFLTKHMFRWSTVREEDTKPFLVEVGKLPRISVVPGDFLEDSKKEIMMKVSNICRSRIDCNMIRFVRQDKRQVISFAIIDDDLPNAFASECSGKFAILINNAIVPLLFGFWNEVSKHSGPMDISFQGVLKPERESRIGVQSIADLWIQLGTEGVASHAKVYGFWEFVRYGLEFIVDHEFAHVFRGHLSIVRKLGLIELSELDNGQEEELSRAAKMQAIELDADYFATYRAISSFGNRRRKARLSRPGSPQYITYGILQNCFTNLCITLYVIPRFHSPHSVQVSNLEQRTHPPFFVRYLKMKGEFDAFCSKNMTSTAKHLEQITLFQCELVYCEVTGSQFDRSLEVEWLSAKIFEYSLNVMKNLDNMIVLFENPLKYDFPVLTCKATMVAHQIHYT